MGVKRLNPVQKATYVELDSFLIYLNSFDSCLNSVNLAVNLFKYFGIKVNFAKSSQTIDFF